MKGPNQILIDPFSLESLALHYRPIKSDLNNVLKKPRDLTVFQYGTGAKSVHKFCKDWMRTLSGVTNEADYTPVNMTIVYCSKKDMHRSARLTKKLQKRGVLKSVMYTNCVPTSVGNQEPSGIYGLQNLSVSFSYDVEKK
jgi:hypothetical protein